MRRFVFRHALSCLLLAAACAYAETPPNIVYILADDLGYGDVRCFNSESRIPTPNLDQLAAGGVRFTDMHSGSAVCTPTRYGILTGRYSWRSKMQKGVLQGLSPALIPADRPTVASFLKQHGYDTAAIGKWHLGLGWTYKDNLVDYSARIPDGPTALGFDTFFGIPASLDMPPYVYVENDHVVEAATAQVEDKSKPLYWRGGPIAPSFTHAGVQPTLASKAVERIAQHAREAADKPLFLYLPLASPHTPVLPSTDAQGRSGIGDYGDFVCDVDDAVGRILAALELAGMRENTLVIFTSDNGYSPSGGLGKDIRETGHNPCPGLRGNKADIFEGGHRIPFIASWPKGIPAGEVRTHTAWLGDLFATAAELVGAPVPEGAAPDSVSLLPALRGKDAPARGPIVHHSADGYFAIRDGNWKLILCAHSGGWSKPKPGDPDNKNLPQRQLYNLADDLAETKNVIADHPDIADRLAATLKTYVENGRSTPGPTLKNDAPVNWEKE